MIMILIMIHIIHGPGPLFIDYWIYDVAFEVIYNYISEFREEDP